MANNLQVTAHYNTNEPDGLRVFVNRTELPASTEIGNPNSPVVNGVTPGVGRVVASPSDLYAAVREAVAGYWSSWAVIHLPLHVAPGGGDEVFFVVHPAVHRRVNSYNGRPATVLCSSYADGTLYLAASLP